MEVLLIMAIGMFIGHRWIPAKAKKGSLKIQLVCTLLLIFAMGAMLGKRPGFLQELTQIGWYSFLFCIIPVLCSIALVYILTYYLLHNRRGGNRL